MAAYKRHNRQRSDFEAGYSNKISHVSCDINIRVPRVQEEEP